MWLVNVSEVSCFFKIFSLQCVHVPFQIVRVSVFRGLHKDFWVKLYKDFWVKLYKDRFYFVSVVSGCKSSPPTKKEILIDAKI